jgi:DNA-binding MarR family transcriptional regulator
MSEQSFRAMEEELSILIRRARARSLETAREVHPELDADAYGLLAALDRADSSRITDLAAAIGVGKGTMSRQVRGLEELGMVRRTADPADRRAFQLELTEDGRRRYRAARDARRARLRRELASWPEDDVTQLASLLHRLNVRIA